MESYELAEAAERAGVSPDELRELVELGILQPDVAGRFSEGDVRRVGVVQSTVAAGIPIDLLADSLRSGQFSLAFMDDPAYDRFTSLTSETFQELSARTGLPCTCSSLSARPPGASRQRRKNAFAKASGRS